ncbi:Ethylene-insensitive protein 2 [Acorus calamus]|uniref:Ethylene-insensitive protein 2 n=1 Tax=Acorus calamus TaxID=4465 RepID=A0AAV9EFI2_ACOCL|nr:Ethylene-insensitive protein 2 [Acorus calamus]
MLVWLPEIPLFMNRVFPRFSRENAYSLMALLGANIMPHNLYVYSSIVQRRQPNMSTSAMCQDHFFALILGFSGIFLVNYGVMNSAANVCQSASFDVLTLQDALSLMDQIFRSPVVPFIIFLVLFLSSQIMALTWTFGGQVVLHNLFDIYLPGWVLRVSMKALVAVVALNFAWSSDAEGLYQLLISCQVLLAMLLPSSVIPLFRVASSKSIMGPFKIPLVLEIFSLCAFLGIFTSNGMFLIELLFGESSWMINLRENMGTSTALLYFVLLAISCASLVSTLYLLVTPLHSASDGSDVQTWNWLQKTQLELFHSENDDAEVNQTQFDEGAKAVEATAAEEPVLQRSMASQTENSVIESEIDLPEVVVHPNVDHQQSRSIEVDCTMSCISPTSNPELKTQIEAGQTLASSNKFSSGELLEACPIKNDEPSLNKFSSGELLEACPIKNNDLSLNKFLSGELLEACPIQNHAPSLNTFSSGELLKVCPIQNDATVDVAVEKDVGIAAVVQTEKDKDGGGPGAVTAMTFEGPPSLKSLGANHDDVSHDSGSLSKLSGLGRAARRQLAAILDEFWGKLFDFHGKLTQDAKDGKFDVILGLDTATVTRSSSVKQDDVMYSESAKFFQEERKPVLSRDYDSPRGQMPNLHSLCGSQMVSSSWGLNPNMQLDAYIQSASHKILDSSERRYASLHVPRCAEGKSYQPLTIHGYKMSSYLSRNSDLLNFIGDHSAPKSPSFASNYGDPLAYSRGQNGFGSLQSSGIQTPEIPMASRFHTERSYYNHPPAASIEAVDSSSGYSKKYHSSPDISRLIMSNRGSSLINKNAQQEGLIAPRSSTNRAGYEQFRYPNSVSKVEGVPLAFDELSPSQLYRNIFPQHLSSDLDTKSLWSKQPFEQLFGVDAKAQNRGCPAFEDRASARLSRGSFSLMESESRLLHSLRLCIMKLLKLEGSEWLLRKNGGYDEELIDLVLAKERYLCVVDSTGELQYALSAKSEFVSMNKSEDANLAGFLGVLVPHCGDGCVWQAGLIMSFGVWCIHRILELSLMESRPELWGKYTYVLNRLQGIRDSAFSKPRTLLSKCSCLDVSSSHIKKATEGVPHQHGKSSRGQPTMARTILDLVKDVEVAVASRKGRRGTAAGDVAFPKGKENLLSVLKRYKHELNKSAMVQEGGLASKAHVPVPHSSIY